MGNTTEPVTVRRAGSAPPGARPDETAGQQTTDKRLLRGARTREAVLRHAVDLGSLEGLDSVSFGRLATATGLSKAGIQTLFRTKEALQLAAIAFARELFVDTVVRPARSAPEGVARLRALVDRWIDYVEAPVLAGGCFRVANLAGFDSRPGPVRDALLRDQEAWRATLAAQVRYAVAAGETRELDVDLTVFQLDALLCAVNTGVQSGDTGAVPRFRRIVDDLLAPPN